jgi:hypothetical protein
MLEYNIDVKWRLNQDKYNLKYFMHFWLNFSFAFFMLSHWDDLLCSFIWSLIIG